MGAEVGVDLIVSDIDGCLLPAGETAYDLALLGRLQAVNHEVRQGHTRFRGITLATGRGTEYVWALGQVIACPTYLICEGGAFLFSLTEGPRCLLDSAAKELLAEGRRVLPEILAKIPYPVAVSLGKAALISLETSEALAPTVAAAVEQGLAAKGLPLRALATTSGFIDVHPPGLDKGQALLALCEATGTDPEQVAVVGDAVNDLPLFERAGIRIAFANALPQLKERATYVSPEPSPGGFYDLLARLRLLPERAYLRLDEASGGR